MVKILLIFIIIWLIMCTYITITYFITNRRKVVVEGDLVQHGVRVKGSIVGEISPNTLVTFLSYNYEYAGKKYTGRQIISKRYRDTFRSGTSVTVLYLPTNPDVAMLERIPPNDRESRISRRLAYRGLILFCIAIPIFLFLLFNNH